MESGMQGVQYHVCTHPSTPPHTRVRARARTSWIQSHLLCVPRIATARTPKSVLDRPTYKAFYDLLDNYEREAGTTETVTATEIAENRHFIDLVTETRPMKCVVTSILSFSFLFLWVTINRFGLVGVASAFGNV